MPKSQKTPINTRVAVVIPNWNGEAEVTGCLGSLKNQTIPCHIIVVDNGSVDKSVELIKREFPEVELVELEKNTGFDGGVNTGIRLAMGAGYGYVALFNNDAVAESTWLECLVDALDSNPKVGIAACKFTSIDNSSLDSTGDIYTSWGLPYPRGRGETNLDSYDSSAWIMGASGGSSLYRVATLQEIGIFDEDFFAYYEDVDISFRAQLAGWKILYEPKSIAHHMIGKTSGRIKGFTTYHTLKNLPWVLWKNVPGKYLWRVVPRFYLAYALIIGRALSRRQFLPVLKGVSFSLLLLPKKLVQRYHIQRNRRVEPAYIWSIMTHDLPPNAHALRRLRTTWWKLVGRAETGK